MCKRFKVGGVPEHFNLPWYRASERGVFDAHDFDYQWEIFPGGTGAMLAALESGDLDLAVLLTEGIVAHIANGGDGVILGTYVDSPLIWGIHVPADSSFETTADLEGQTFAISRPRSGSHIMAYVLAEQMAWADPRNLNLELVGDLPGARIALGEGQADVFMWEKYTTKPLVDSGEWRMVGTCTTPWPPFVLATRKGFAVERMADIEALVGTIRTLCGELTADPDATAADVATRFGQRPEDARQWLSETHWACELAVDAAELEGVVETLVGVGVIDEAVSVDELI